LKRRGLLGLLALVVGALALLAAGCGGGDDEGNGDTSAGGEIQALPASSCTGQEFKGQGEPDFLIASDLPMQGSARGQTTAMVQAIRYVLKQRNYKAGKYNLAYQVCDDSTAQAGKWDSGKCNQNARAYANNKSVIGVIGTYNSGCALIIIPVLNQAPDGPVAMVSPANTYVCITEGTGCDASEPDKYYPSGKRNYARVVPYDAYQAAVDAQLSKDIGVKKVYILNDKEAYGLGVALLYRAAAEKLGIQIAGFSAWAKESASYESIMRRIKSTGADGVFLGGLIEENGGQVIKDKVSVLGSNDDVKLIGPDGFAQQATIDDAGADSAAGMYVTVAGAPAERLTGEGKSFVDGFRKFSNVAEGQPIDPYAAYSAQAAVVLLDAIAKSDGTRADVAANLFQSKVENGILGTFDINKNGDVSQPKGGVVNYSVFKLAKVLETYKVMVPENSLVEWARTHVKSD
jgi:branched-chain amino acid transport system substrate-binding protein